MNELDFSSILSWWSSLKEDTGGRAELRREHNPTEVVFLPAYHRLYGKLDSDNINKESLACVVGLCAHVKENREGKLAEQMAECKPGSKNPKTSSSKGLNRAAKLFCPMGMNQKALNAHYFCLDFYQRRMKMPKKLSKVKKYLILLSVLSNFRRRGWI